VNAHPQGTRRGSDNVLRTFAEVKLVALQGFEPWFDG
jgi:hypothetical protein